MRRPKEALTTVSTVSRVGDAAFDDGDRLAPEGVLEAVADEAGDVFFDVDRGFADLAMQSEGPFDHRRVGPFGLDDLDQGNQEGRVPPMGADRAGAVG